LASAQDKAFRAERRAQIARRSALLQGARDEIVALLQDASARITTMLAAQPSDYEQWRLTQLQSEVQLVLDGYKAAVGPVVSNSITTAWKAGQDLVDKPVEAGGIQIGSMLGQISTQQLEAMDAFMLDRIRDIGTQAASKIKTELGMVILGAQSPGAAAAKVQALLGEDARARATMIVRTELGRVYSVATYRRLLQSAERLPGMRKMWRRSGKLHSRIAHDAIDGQTRKMTEPFDVAGVPMQHPHDPTAPAEQVVNCGCVLLPHMVNWTVSTPGAKPFTAQELKYSPAKRLLADAGKGPSLNELLDGPPASTSAYALPNAPRTSWGNFPAAVIHQPLNAAKLHPMYAAAKAGDLVAAFDLVNALLSDAAVARIAELIGAEKPIVVAVHAEEAVSINRIPMAFAEILANRLGLETDTSIVQAAKVSRTGGDGFYRLANNPSFDGYFPAGQAAIILDDTLTQGGTLASLKGHIEGQGGRVLAASTLTGHEYSATMAITKETLDQLRLRYETLEQWWSTQFGYGFDRLTESEGRYLLKLKGSPDANAVRDRILAARQGRQ